MSDPSLEAFRDALITKRVVTRVLATEFTSPEALKDYLHEHPHADKSKHTVKKDQGEEHGEHKEEPKKSWAERLKGLSDKAKAFVKDAPKAVKQFVEDPEFRKGALKDAQKALKESPKKLVHSALETAKHEVKEFKAAGQGIAAVIKGGKMDEHQKKALKTVATHMAISIAAASLTATGPLAAAGAVGKAFAKHVAMKAVSKALGHVHILQELGHIGHGVHHLMEHIASEDADPDPEEVLGNFIAASVAKELEQVSDDDVVKALEGEEPEEPKEPKDDKPTKQAYSYARF